MVPPEEHKNAEVTRGSYLVFSVFQTKGKFIMLKVLKELSGKSSFRPVSEGRSRSKSQSTMVSMTGWGGAGRGGVGRGGERKD